MKLLFATGNQGKADRLAQYIETEIDHEKLDLDEIQSMDLKEIARYKVLQAYSIVKRPVLVDDTGLEFDCLNGLPGPFIAHFLKVAGQQAVCDMVTENRQATARTVFGYYDGKVEKYLEGSCKGSIAKKPAGKDGFGWDPIFIPEGYSQTRAELADTNPEVAKEIYLKIKPIKQLKTFLDQK